MHDCFASEYICQLLCFRSKFYVPNVEAVDTFTVNWSSETYWLVPPLYLVGHALLDAEACKARLSHNATGYYNKCVLFVYFNRDYEVVVKYKCSYDIVP